MHDRGLLKEVRVSGVLETRQPAQLSQTPWDQLGKS